jgi:hypothetical protein
MWARVSRKEQTNAQSAVGRVEVAEGERAMREEEGDEEGSAAVRLFFVTFLSKSDRGGAPGEGCLFMWATHNKQQISRFALEQERTKRKGEGENKVPKI